MFNFTRDKSDVKLEVEAKSNVLARWKKSVQHLREVGQIEDSPRDIGKLMKEVNVDVLKECEAEIKEELFKQAWPKIARIITAGLPEWWKTELLEKQFHTVPSLYLDTNTD